MDEFWKNRIDLVLLSPDNEKIHRVANAGKVMKDTQVMHNGIKIHVGSYYGNANTVLLYKHKDVHEPQEERIFNEVIGFLPPEAVMLELGAFWVFYSMVLEKEGLYNPLFVCKL